MMSTSWDMTCQTRATYIVLIDWFDVAYFLLIDKLTSLKSKENLKT